MKQYLIFVCCSLLLIFSPVSHSADGVVIANTNSFSDFSNTEKAKSTIRLLFLKRKLSWPNSEKAKPYSLPTEHLAVEKFTKKVLKMSPSQIDLHWIKARQVDGTLPPINVRSERLLTKMVKKVPHSFGIVSKMYWDKIAHQNPDIKVLFEF